MTNFRTFNFGSSFQVHILSLSHVVILEGKCFKVVPNQCHQHLITIIPELFFNTFFLQMIIMDTSWLKYLSHLLFYAAYELLRMSTSLF